MKKFFLSKNYSDKFTASSKAKMDAEYIARKIGFKNIGLKQLTYQNKIGRLWTFLSNKIGILRMPSDGVFLGQYPSYGIEEQIRKAKENNNKTIIIIHDINKLRQLDDNSMKPLYEADILIAHNAKMKEWLETRGVSATICTLEVFDYITDDQNVNPPLFPKDGQYQICFAGNLGKSEFLNNVSLNNGKFKLFGIGFGNLKPNSSVEYVGCFAPNELRFQLNSHFGLVWDGTSCESCDGVNGTYLKYIAPHKLSMYLASNLPVIVWRESAMSDFVIRNNIGIVVNSISEIDNRLAPMTESEYNEKVKNAAEIGKKIREGFFLSKILKDI